MLHISIWGGLEFFRVAKPNKALCGDGTECTYTKSEIILLTVYSRYVKTSSWTVKCVQVVTKLSSNIHKYYRIRYSFAESRWSRTSLFPRLSEVVQRKCLESNQKRSQKIKTRST